MSRRGGEGKGQGQGASGTVLRLERIGSSIRGARGSADDMEKM